MNAKEENKFDKYEDEIAFMDANESLYPEDSPGFEVAEEMRPDILLVREFAAGQISGVEERGQRVFEKQDDLDELEEILIGMDNAGIALADKFPGIENLFGVPRNRSENSMTTAARAQYDLSEPYEAAMSKYDLAPNFRAKLLAVINRIDAANASAEVSGEKSVGSTGGLKAAMARLGKNSKKLGAINRNKFRGNPVKLAEWLTASRLKREPKRVIEPKTGQ